ncbi:MAG: nicotinate (nicotinamide) nucleotide adenylyltransferase [Bacteroidales bacterium]
MKKIGIFPGSFNPVHIGHLALANYICEYAHLDEIWMMVSPHNPLKELSNLSSAEDRLEMLRIALMGDKKIKASDFELSLPQPSYTITTLERLSSLHKDCEFTLIIGGDNWSSFHKWKSWQKIVDNYNIIVYPRKDEAIVEQENVRVIKAPLIEVSSTMIRDSIKDGLSLRYLVPNGVFDYIVDNKLYGI